MMSNFDPNSVMNLWGLWDFRNGAETNDTGLDDGFAQNGHFHGNGNASGDRAHFDGNGDYFDVSGEDDPFDLDSGTIEVQFTQDQHVGSSPDTLVNRGEQADWATEGYFSISVLNDGSVQVIHCANGEDAILTTDPGIFSPGDNVNVKYSWDAATGGVLIVENLTTGGGQTLDHTVTNLDMDIGDNDDENFTFGAREEDDGSYDRFFDGSIDYVAIYDAPAPQGDGIVEGTAGDDVIDINYLGDPEGDRIDNEDAILPGEAPNDDIVEAGAGDDTILSGEGDDEVYAGSGDDYVEGGVGNDIIYGDSNYDGGAGGSVREVFQWSEAPNFGDENDASGFTQDTGNTNVTFAILTETNDADIEYETEAGNTDDIDTGGLGPVDEDSNLAMESEDDDDVAKVRLDFSDDVENVEFRINDIDFDSQVRVQAFDSAGNLIPLVLTAGSNLTLSDTDGQAGNDTATSQGGGEPASGDNYSLLVEIAGPVARIEILHTNIDDNNSHVQVGDIYFDALLPDTGPDGNDELYGGDGNDEIYGEGGNDLVDGGDGDDVLDGGDGDDEIIGGDGSDEVMGGDGDDVIDTSGSNPLPDDGFGAIVPEDPDPFDDRDIVDGGDGNDTITTGDDVDIIDGGDGDDWIDGGLDDDRIDGGDGDDTIIGGEGSDNITGGDGDDLIYGGINNPAANIPDAIDPELDNGDDIIRGGDGNDTIFGEDDNDYITGDDGNDYLDGGIDDDEISGGDGDDIIIGGEGADDLMGGDDRDVFQIGPDGEGGDMIGDTVDGGAGGDDYDILDLTGSAPDGGSLNVTITGPDSNGNGVDGFVEYFDENGDLVGRMDFEEIEEIVPCFTPGTTIATPKGERLVEDLRVGDKIITRDNGIQEIRWLGSKRLDWKDLNVNPHLRPVLLKAGSLGGGLPERDMLVSPNHRVLVANDKTALYFEEREVLAAAKHLTNANGVMNVPTLGTTYIHFMFDNHEVVLSNGAWTESFQPGDYSLKGLGNAQRTEIFELFPELRNREGMEDYSAARKTLKKHEARLLVAK